MSFEGKKAFAVTLFGEFRVSFDNNEVRGFRGDSTRGLLAYLCMEHGRAHRRGMLATLFWPNASSKEGLHNLRTSLYRLRKALDKIRPNTSNQLLTTTRRTIEWHHNPALLAVDALILTAATTETSLKKIDHAIALYQGEFIRGFALEDAEPFDEWLLLKREQMQQTAITLLDTFSRRSLEVGQWEDTVRGVQQLLKIEAWHEAAYRYWMIALGHMGQRTAALALFDRCCDVLETELGISPSNETLKIFEQIRDGAIAPTVATPQPIAPVPSHQRKLQHNLPSSMTLMVDRMVESAEVATLLQRDDIRWVTLVGAGGVGKTRLSIAVGRRLVDQFADGVWFVPLAQLQDGANAREQIATLTATSMKLPLHGKASAETQLVNALREKTTLLILDNFEHLANSAELVFDLLAAVPRLTVLCTSREPLHFMAERVYPLAGLIVPTSATVATIEQHPALQLFVDRAQRAYSPFQPTDETLPLIIQLCQFVGGNALGIELAASFVRRLSVEKILAMVHHSYRRLETRLRDVPQRHRSMLTVLNDSWRLLDAELQTTLAQLSIFRGGFSAEAATAVANADLFLLDALADKSLIQRLDNDRFGMHEVLRQFSAEQLPPAQLPSLRQRHSHAYLRFLADREDALQRDAPQIPAAEIDTELDNIRLAWQTGLNTHACDAIFAALHGISNYYQLRGRSQEAERLFAETADRFQLENCPVGQQIVARSLVERARYLNRLTRCAEAFESAQSAILIAEATNDAWAHDMGRIISAEALWRQSEYDDAKAELEATYIQRQPRNNTLSGWYHHQQGIISARTSNHQKAVHHYQLAIEIWETTNQLERKSNSLSSLGMALCHIGEFESAEPLILEAVDIQTQLSALLNLAHSWNNLGIIATESRCFDKAESAYKRAMEIAAGIGSVEIMAFCGLNLGYQANLNEQFESAIQHLNRAKRLASQQQHHYLLGRIEYNLATAFIGQASFEEATYHFAEANRLAKHTNDLEVVSRSTLSQAKMALNVNQLEHASLLGIKAATIAQELGHRELQNECTAFIERLSGTKNADSFLNRRRI